MRITNVFASVRTQQLIGIVFTTLAIATLLVSCDSTNRQRRNSEQLESYVKCQTEWTNFLYQAISASRSSSQESTAALDELIKTVSTATSRDQSAAALRKYQEARAKQIKSQNENPLPEAPKEACRLED